MISSIASTAIDTLISVIVFVVLVWMFLGASAGALMANRASVGKASAIAIGALVGPLVIPWLLIRTWRQRDIPYREGDVVL